MVLGLMAVISPAKYLDLLPGEVREALNGVIELLNRAFDGHWLPNDLGDAAYYYIRNRGKMIRPTLVLLTAYSLRGNVGNAILPAASVELIHIASLLQDDIMDRQMVRRGVKTPYSIYGPNMAMLASDLAIAKAVEYAIRSGDNDIVFELLNASIKLAAGQGFEMELSGKDSITIDDYMRLVYNKTAALIESSMVVGAYSVGVKDPSTINVLRDVGRNVGLAFQVRDDVIDYQNLDPGNPMVFDDEVNIVKILIKEGLDMASSIARARSMVNELLDNAVRGLSGLIDGSNVLIKYINLLRI